MAKMKLTRLHIEDFKRVLEITMDFPSAGVVAIGGENGAGKSSIKEFLAAAFGGATKLPPVPVNKGAKKSLGKITLDNEGHCITVDLVITPEREMKVEVRQDGGAPFNGPMAMLRSWVNTFSFNPFDLMELTGRPQRDMMLKCLGVDFADLEAEAETIKEERKQAGRDVAGREKQIASMPEYSAVPTHEIRTADLAAELQKGMDHNALVEQFAKAETEWQMAVTDAVDEVKEMEERLARAKKGLVEAEEGLKRVRGQRTALKSLVDLAPINRQIADADATNAKVRANAARAALVDQFRADHERFAELGESLKGIDRQKAERLAKAPTPVEGLEFRDDEVYFKGLPLSQDSDSGRMIRSVELAAALNPKLRCIVVDKGEQMMIPKLKELDAWATEHDFLVIDLRASVGKECAFIMEEGKVREPKKVTK